MRFSSPSRRICRSVLLVAGAGLASMPAAAEDGVPPYAVLGARLLIEGEATAGSIVLRDGKIAVVGAGELVPPPDAIVLDGAGWTLYPGFIDAHTELGMPSLDMPHGGSLLEIARNLSERRRSGEPSPGLRPDVRAAELYSVDEDDLEGLRRAGVTTAVVAPRTLVFGGTSAVVATRDGDPRRSLLSDAWAQHVAFERLRGEYPSTLMGVLAAVRQWFWDARWQADAWRLYEQAPRRIERPPFDERLAALAAAATGRQQVVFSAWTENEILRALSLADELGLEALISGGTEAWKVADELAQARTPVLVTLDLRPRTEPKGFGGGRSGPKDDPSEREKADAVANAARLHEAGVRFAFTTHGLEDPAQWLESLRQVVEAGLPKAAALAALTTQPAALLGLDDTLGSLEPGRAAHVVALNGDLFDDGATVAAVWVDGELYEIEAKSSDKGEADKGGPEQVGRGGRRSGNRAAASSERKEDEKESEHTLDPDRIAPPGPLWPEEEVTAIRHGTVLTAALEGPQRIEDGTVLVRDGRIDAVGPDAEVEIPSEARIVDATGKFVIPGIVDAHSHMAITGGGNESSESVTPEVRIDEIIDHTDVGIFRALAGGVTTINVLHGSANVIGGQNAVLKLRWGKGAADLFFEGAPRGIKFALGENPKRSRFSPQPGVPQRYPGSRLGVEVQLRRAFTEARQYQAAWEAYEALQRQGDAEAALTLPPRRNLRLEALVDVLEGRILVHAHCYRSDEIAMLLEVAEDFGFRITSLQHVLEGYKVADEIAAHGAGASTFADSWAYKMEAYDAIPFNMALMAERGVRVSVNSDSEERVRRLFQEGAKAVKYGGVSEEEALRMITLHAAWQLGIDERIGSLEPGKDADIAVFSAHPFAAEAQVELTFVDGQVYFDRSRVQGAREGLVELAEAATKAADEGRKPRRERDRKDDRPAGEAREPRAVAERYASWSPPSMPETPPATLALPSDYGDVATAALPRRGTETVALVGGTVLTMAGPPIEGGTVLVAGGRIVAVGRDLEIPEAARRIDTTGMRVHPGLIDAGTSLGLSEVAAVAATQDLGEIDEVNSTVKASVAIHPHSELIPVTRVNGVTSALTLPRGGTVGGQAAFLDLDGWTPAEVVARSPIAMQITFPEKRPRRFGDDDESAREERFEERRSTLEQWLRRARAYAGALAAEAVDPAEQEIDLELQALVPVVRGELPVLIEVETAEGIDAALELVEKLELRAILAGSRDYWLKTDALSEAGVPVLLGPIERSPEEDAPYDAIYATAALLHEKGIPFAFRTADAANARNLPYHAALAVAHGLSREAAWRALTVGAARILGVDDLVGSLEPGKLANIVVTDGDLLDVPAQVQRLFIRGHEVPLESRHTELWERFRSRPPASARTVPFALRAGDAIDIDIDIGAAEAVLSILDARRDSATVADADWNRLFATEGYRRLKKREAAMGRDFEDAEFRDFVLSAELLDRLDALRVTLDDWRTVRPEQAAERVRRYLPAGARIRATIYPMIKPQTNSFVFELQTDPAIFFYLDPSLTKASFENTMAHELHHVGYAAACPDSEPGEDRRADEVRRWIGAFGEGLAMLAAAGGPEIHPHASSPPKDRQRWDGDVARFDEDLKKVERFFLDILDGTLATAEERLQVARSFYGVQGPWYTVGWKMAAVIEETVGRQRLVSVVCDPVSLLELYNEAAKDSEGPLAIWSEAMLERLRPASAR